MKMGAARAAHGSKPLSGSMLSVKHTGRCALSNSGWQQSYTNVFSSSRYRCEKDTNGASHDALGPMCLACPGFAARSKASRAHRSGPNRRAGPLGGRTRNLTRQTRDGFCVDACYFEQPIPLRLSFICNKLQLRSTTVSQFDGLQKLRLQQSQQRLLFAPLASCQQHTPSQRRK